MSAIGLNEFLVVGFVSALGYLLFRHYYKQRYKEHINKVHGPALPLLAHMLWFRLPKNSTGFVEIFDSILLKYPPPMKMYFGLQQLYGTTDPEELEVILRHPAANEKIRHIYKVLEKAFGKGLVTDSGDSWKKKRRTIEPIFNQALLNDFVPAITEKVHDLVSNFRKRLGNGSFDIEPFVNDCFLSIAFEFVMGINKNDISFDLGAIIFRCSEIAYTKIFSPACQFNMIYKWTALAKEEEELLRKGHKFIEEEIIKRGQQLNVKIGSQENATEIVADIVDDNVEKKYVTVMDVLLEKGNFTLKQIRDEISTFMSAGFDSTAFILKVTFIMLGMFPEVQEKVYEEVMDVIGADRNLEHQDLSKLKYLEMVIKETMRLFPITPFIGRRLHDNVELKTRTLPKGLNFFVPIMHLHRNKKYWPEPLKFIPERFTPEECAKRHPYTWLPFSGGPRNCIGMRLSLMEIKIAIAMTVRECLIKTDYSSIEEMKLIPNIVSALSDGYACSMELRK